jgi:hypothetical protein
MDPYDIQPGLPTRSSMQHGVALLLLTLVSIILLAMLANHLWAIRTH